MAQEIGRPRALCARRAARLALSVLLVAAGAAAAQVDLSEVVVLGANSVDLNQNAQILSGHVIANGASEGPTLACSGRELCVGVSVDTAAGYSVRGDSVQLKQNSVVGGDLYYNELTSNGTVNGALVTPLALPVVSFPPFVAQSPRPDAPSVEVPVHGFATIEPGDYLLIKAKQNSTVVFTGGTYNIGELDLGVHAEVSFEGPSELRIEGKFALDQNASFGPAEGSGISAADIVVYVAGINGNNGNLGSTPKAAQLGVHADAHGCFYVPNGTLLIKQNAVVTGAFLGRDVQVGVSSDVALDSCFGNRAPTADDQDLFTLGAATLDILLTGSDPDDDSLTFAIVQAPTAGSLGALSPVVPDPIGHCSVTEATVCTLDADCPGGETCIDFVQPPVVSAEVTYTPADPGAEEEDSFQFSVTDPLGESAVGTVRINPAGDPTGGGNPDVVETADTATETPMDVPVTIFLSGAAPATVSLQFSIVAGPSNGSLGTLIQGSETPRRTATVDYTPNSGFLGVDSFTFQAAGDLNGDGDTADAGETAVGTATIGVVQAAPPEPPTAANVVTGTEGNTPVTIQLSGTPGSGALGQAPITAKLGSARGGGRNGARTATKAPITEAPVPIGVGAGWSATTAVPPAFFWGGGEPVFSSSGPFTFDGTACVSVTDDFDKGDQFTVYDNGQPVGTTPAVPVVTTGLELGPDAAYFDSTYSSGSFLVTGDAGHSISIELVSNPFGGGRGYLRVDSPESAFCDGECGLVFAVVTPPQHGSVSVITQTTGTTGEIVYTPDESFSGIDSFTYSVTDCYGNVATGTVTVTVTDSSPCVECDRVTVQLAGSGSGTVTSNPLIVDSNSGLILGILCPDLCETDFTAGSTVGLQARPEGTSVFTGWGGDCSGSSPLLVISLSSDMTCTATFEAD